MDDSHDTLAIATAHCIIVENSLHWAVTVELLSCNIIPSQKICREITPGYEWENYSKNDCRDS